MENIKKIADFIIADGTKNTGTGSWIVYPDEISTELGIDESWVLKNTAVIVDELAGRPEVADIEFVDGGFDTVFWLSCCLNWDGTEDWGCL